MRRKRFIAPRRQKERKKVLQKRRDLQWLDREVREQKAWTKFCYAFHRLSYCYNPRDDVYAKIKTDYLRGKPATSETAARPPRSRESLRQDILATILILGYGLSKSEFITAKQLATKRNIRHSAMSEEEVRMWPARPDVFRECPERDPAAVSDDEIADFFRNEFYPEQLAELEEEDPSLTDDEGPSTSENISPQGRSAEFSEFNSSVGDQEQARCRFGEQAPHPTAVRMDFNDSRFELNNRSVAVLKDLCLRIGKWGPIRATERRYRISRSKAHELRKAVTELKDGKLDGISWTMFAETFEDEDLMSMPMQKNKEASIRQAVSTFNSE